MKVPRPASWPARACIWVILYTWLTIHVRTHVRNQSCWKRAATRWKRAATRWKCAATRDSWGVRIENMHVSKCVMHACIYMHVYAHITCTCMHILHTRVCTYYMHVYAHITCTCMHILHARVYKARMRQQTWTPRDLYMQALREEAP